MRFGKGSKVEVLSKRDVPSGSWFPAEIVSGNGRYYNVKCDGDHSLEKVQRRSIRPRPPPISRSGSWAPGDIVEVLENNSWKEAKIMEVIDGGNYAVVMLVESSEELKLHGSNIRIRRYWNDNRWVLGDKEFEHLNAGNMVISHDMEKFDNRKLQRRAVVNIRKGHNQFHAENNSYTEEHCQFSLRGLRKRSSFCLPTLVGDARAGAGRKMGSIKEVVKRQRLLTSHSSKIPEKVDACVSSRIIPGEKYMGAPLNNRNNGFSEAGMNWGNPKEDVHFFLGSLEHSESDSHSSSVGSCSPSSCPYMSLDHHESNPNHDVEVSSGSVRETSEHTGAGETVQIHQLELNAYHSIILALYASGPLSWEREAMLTNLRLVLHITNDEHLMELRHLNTYQR